jgi:hypothetical protein
MTLDADADADAGCRCQDAGDAGCRYAGMQTPMDADGDADVDAGSLDADAGWMMMRVMPDAGCRMQTLMMPIADADAEIDADA